MYRDDQEALQQRLEGTSREAERLRRENDAMRAAVGRLQVSPPATVFALPPGAIYNLVDVGPIPLEERARLATHSLRRFPVWAIAVLHIVTLGVYPLIHFALMHDRLPRAATNDPSAGKAVGFSFIPYYNLYWVFFSTLRLCDRLSLQLKLRGLPDRAPRALLLATCIIWVIPYVNLIIGFPIMWTIAVCLLQSTVNRIALLRPTEWDATVMPAATAAPAGYLDPGAPSPAYQNQGYQNQGYASPAYQSPALQNPMSPAYAAPVAMLPSPEQLAQAARARMLVNWSHLLGWGGLAVLVLGTSAAAALSGGVAATVIGVLSGVCVVVGAIVGQIGRGMQGRAI